MAAPPASPSGTVPRWVKVSAMIGAVVGVLFIIMLFTGHGPSRHLQGGNPPSATNGVAPVGTARG